MSKQHTQSSVSEYLRRLADSIDEGDIAVRNISCPTPQVERDGPITFLWTPEIEFLVVNPRSTELYDLLQRATV